jgi:histidinol-phosphate/aromatic aminotransferase/cobyric acid decarboxylase-like protein
MTFPLGEWIDSHEHCRHNLGESGMHGVVGPVRPTARAVRGADAAELRSLLAASVDVAADRIFLTHGASEGNGWVALYLGRTVRGRGVRRCRIRRPEYPPLAAIARWAGFTPASGPGPAALAILSNPRNPEGTWMDSAAVHAATDDARHVLVDETFREFARVPSYSGDGRRGVWRTGTFTKYFGADDLRVGFVVAPEEERTPFARFHDHFADKVPPYSLAAAVATWRARARIRSRVEAVFRRNAAVLRAADPAAPPLAAPVYFDRPVRPNGRALAERCLAASVLICPGDFFGDATGVRIGLTRPSFPRDYRAYRAVRDRALRGRR